MKPFVPLLALLLSFGAAAAEVSDATVEKILGVSGAKHSSKAQNRYGIQFSDVEYQDGKGQTLFTLRLGTPEQYALWKQAAGEDAQDLSGVGQEAFRYKSFKAVCAKSATVAACVTPDFLLKSPAITDAHLQALLKAAL